LSTYFIEWLAKSEGLPVKQLTEATVRKLQNMNWPGNIRQLKNTIERALILGGSKTAINPEDIFEFVETEKNSSQNNGMDFGGEFFADKSLRSAREEFERAYLKYQIGKFGGNVSKTASYVGMERSALHRKMKLLNIESTLKEK
jgi:two-component system nitrogen regulation response regulator NtrX